MPLATQLITDELFDLVAEFSAVGGAVDFKFFTIKNVAGKEAHLEVARATLQALAKDGNFYSEMIIHALEIEEGTSLKPEDFFGPYLHWPSKRTIVAKLPKEIPYYPASYQNYFYTISRMPVKK
jgi:hypothetical protein